MSDIEQTTSQTLPPPDNLDLIPEEMLQYGALLAGLTTIQQRVLWAMIENMTSDDILPDTALAENLGISRNTIARARRNPVFQQALGVIARDSLRGIHDKIIGRVLKAGEKDWRADEFLVKYDGSYVPSSQSMNINANITPGQAQNTSIEDSNDAYLIRLGELGWNRTRVAALAERFDELKAEGAF